MKKLNKKGFTLVELLAVIVVLAFIMVLAYPSILDSMNNAKKSSFILYGQKMLNNAKTKYESDSLVNSEVPICYNFSELTDTGSSGNYTGYVIMNNLGTSRATYKVVMTDGNYFVGTASSYAGVDFAYLDAAKKIEPGETNGLLLKSDTLSKLTKECVSDSESDNYHTIQDVASE